MIAQAGTVVFTVVVLLHPATGTQRQVLPVFVLQRGRTYVLGVSWAGSEGQSLAVFVSNGGNRFTQVIGDYWYQAPRRP